MRLAWCWRATSASIPRSSALRSRAAAASGGAMSEQIASSVTT
jgi:hypothetical protein